MFFVSNFLVFFSIFSALRPFFSLWTARRLLTPAPPAARACPPPRLQPSPHARLPAPAPARAASPRLPAPPLDASSCSRPLIPPRRPPDRVVCARCCCCLTLREEDEGQRHKKKGRGFFENGDLTFVPSMSVLLSNWLIGQVWVKGK